MIGHLLGVDEEPGSGIYGSNNPQVERERVSEMPPKTEFLEDVPDK